MTHTMRPTKASLIYRRITNLRAVQRRRGRATLKSTVRYLGVENVCTSCPRAMRHPIATAFLSICFVPGLASAGGGALETANQFLALIRSGKFEQAASQFRYPDIFSDEERRADEAAIASGLESLFKITGKFQRPPQPETGMFVTVKVTIRAGDAAHPIPSPDGLQSAAYRFSAQMENYPDGAVQVELDSDSGTWKISSLSFGLPASDPSSLTRMKRLLDQMLAEREARKRIDGAHSGASAPGR